jgi:hypothetical protein
MIDREDFLPFSDELSSDKVYCANCIHCKLIKIPMGAGGQYGLRVRCDAGKWRKKLGEEKVYKYFTVIRRTIEQCDTYEPMGEVEVFLKELRSSLPIKDETYSL